LKAAVDRKEIGVCSALDKIEEALTNRGLMTTGRLPPGQVGIDQENRGQLGGSFNDVHLLADDIVRLGFSWPKTAHASAAEITPGDRSEEVFNQELAATWTTDDPEVARLAPVPDGSLTHTSVACTHTNAGLRCAPARVPCNLPYISRDGFMDLSKIRERDPVYAEAAEGGLRWKIFRWQVRHMYPWLLSFVSAVRNTDQHVARAETMEQGMSQIHRLASAAMARNVPVAWEEIQEKVALTKPPFVEDLGALVAFVSAKAGGLQGDFLAAYNGFCRMFVKSNKRRLPAALYLATADFPEDLPSAYAVLVTAYTCPEEHVQHLTCNWVSAANVAALAKSRDPKVRARVSEVRDGLSKVWANLQRAGCNTPPQRDNQLTAVLMRVQVNAGRYLLDKQGPSRVKFASGAAIFSTFARNFAQTFPDRQHSVFTALFPEPAEAAQAESPTSQNQPAFGLYEAAPSGHVTDPLSRLRAAGFDTGSCVSAAAVEVPNYYRISTVFTASSEEYVCLVPWEGHAAPLAQGGQETTTPEFQQWVRQARVRKQGEPSWYLKASALIAAYYLANPKSIVVKHPGWPSCHTAVSPATQVLRARAAIITGLAALSARAQATNDPTHGLELQIRPQRVALTTMDFPANSLVLVPDALNLKVTEAKADEEEGGGAGEAMVEPGAWYAGSGGKRFWLAAATAEENVAPFWFARPTHDPAQANMDLREVEVEVAADVAWPSAIVALPQPPAATQPAPSQPAPSQSAAQQPPPAQTQAADAAAEAEDKYEAATQRAVQAEIAEEEACRAAQGRGPRTKEGKAAKTATANREFWAKARSRAGEALEEARAAAIIAPEALSADSAIGPETPGSQAGPAPPPQDAAGKAAAETPSLTVTLQVLANSRPLRKGVELTYYRPAGEKKAARKANPITFQSFAKKTRVSK